MIISNSSPLILLAKIGKLQLLQKSYKTVLISYGVYKEVVLEGKKENYSDAALIEKYINEFIFIKNFNEEYKKEAQKLGGIVGIGESEAIALCLQEKSKFLLMDNLEPRKIAKSLNLECISTLSVLLLSLKNKSMTAQEYVEAVKELSKYAWLSGDIVAHFLDMGYTIKQGESNENR